MSSSQPRAEAGDLKGAVWAPGVRLSIYDHVFSDLRHEVGGFLLGRRGAGDKLTISAEVPAYSADKRTASVTFTQQDWADVHAAIETRDHDEQIVGWYHSHPGFGIFLSEFDLFIHRNFFSNPGQVAYVVDPHAGREGVFGWREGDVTLLAEGDTSRPGERPELPAAAPAQTARWRPKHYVPAIVVGLLIGVLAAWGIASLGGGNEARKAVTKRTTTHRPPRQGAPSKTEGRAPRTQGPRAKSAVPKPHR